MIAQHLCRTKYHKIKTRLKINEFLHLFYLILISNNVLIKTSLKRNSLFIKTTILNDNHIQRYRYFLPLLFWGYTHHMVLPTGYVYIVQIKVPLFVSPLLCLTIYFNGSVFICLVVFIGKREKQSQNCFSSI
jgi:hypothetical protein